MWKVADSIPREKLEEKDIIIVSHTRILKLHLNACKLWTIEWYAFFRTSTINNQMLYSHFNEGHDQGSLNESQCQGRLNNSHA